MAALRGALMTLRRIGALVIAVVLVAGAAMVRVGLLDDGESSGGSSDNPGRAGRELVCITELAAVCAAIGDEIASLTVRVEDAGATLDTLVALDDAAGAPLWLTTEPYPAMVDSQRSARRVDEIGYATTPLGASRLGVAFPADGRAQLIGERCDHAELWTCYVDNAGARWTDLGGSANWQTFRPVFGDVPRSATALSSFAHAVSGFLGTATFGTAQLEAPSFIGWIRPMTQSTGRTALSGGTPLLTMVTRPSALDAGATSSAEVTSIGSSADRFEVIYPGNDMWMQAVLASPPEAGTPADLADRLAQLVTGAAGWQPPAAAANAVPGAATMAALRSFWVEAT